MDETRILVVDDESIAGLDLQRRLQQLGYAVAGVAGSGEEAVAKAEETRPDLVLMDIRMPGRMDGIEAARQISERFGIPVVYVTEYGDEATLERAKPTAPFGYILKPLDDRDLRIGIEIGLYRDCREKALRASEERHRATLDGMVAGCQIIDFDWRYVYVNDAAARQGRRPKEELLGRTIMEICPRIEGTEVFASLQKCMYDRARYRMENLFAFPDGSQGWFELSIQPVPEGIFVLSLDITQRQEAEIALRQSRERLQEREDYYRSLIHQLHEDIVVVDREYVITDVNDRFMGTTGLPREQVIGRHCYEVTHRSDVPCDQIGERCLLKEVFRDGQVRSCQHTHVKADGSKVIVDILLSPLKDKEGVTTHVIEAMRDITEHVEAKEDLLRLRKAVDTSGEAIFLADRDGIITYVNPEFTRLYGHTPAEVVGKQTPRILKSGVMAPEDYEAFWKTLLNGQVVRGELINRTNDGRLITIEGSANPILDGHGNVSGFLAIQRDITERKRAEKQLQDSLSEKEELLREVHHRVKNNLQIIVSLLNLQSMYVSDPEMLGVLRTCQQRVKSMASVHEMLYRSANLAEIDSGRYVKELTGYLLDSCAVAPGAVSMQVQVEEKLTLNLDTAVPCGLIINELVGNSLKHAFPEGRKGQIRVSLGRQGDGKLLLTVSDNGIGFPDDQDFRNTKSLGMQLVVNLARQLQGTIELNRQGGTEWRVLFAPSSQPGGRRDENGQPKDTDR